MLPTHAWVCFGSGSRGGGVGGREEKRPPSTVSGLHWQKNYTPPPKRSTQTYPIPLSRGLGALGKCTTASLFAGHIFLVIEITLISLHNFIT